MGVGSNLGNQHRTGAHKFPVHRTGSWNRGDILSLNTFPIDLAYLCGTERTLFAGRRWTPPPEDLGKPTSRPIEYGIEPAEPVQLAPTSPTRFNAFLEERDLLQYRTFG